MCDTGNALERQPAFVTGCPSRLWAYWTSSYTTNVQGWSCAYRTDPRLWVDRYSTMLSYHMAIIVIQCDRIKHSTTCEMPLLLH
jgi:hypothetical protein